MICGSSALFTHDPVGTQWMLRIFISLAETFCTEVLHTPCGPESPRTFGNHGEGSYTDVLCSEEGSVHCLYFHLCSHTTAYMGRVPCVPALKLYTRRGSEISQGKAQHLPCMQTEVAKASEAASKVGWVRRAWKDRWGRQSNRDWYGHTPYLEQLRDWYGHIPYLEQLPSPRITELPQGT